MQNQNFRANVHNGKGVPNDLHDTLEMNVSPKNNGLATPSTSPEEATADGVTSYTEITPSVVNDAGTHNDSVPDVYSQNHNGMVHTHSPMELFIRFNKEEEKIYQAHFRRQKLRLLPVLVTLAIIHATLTLILGLVEFSKYDDLARLVTIPCLAALVVSLQVFVALSLLPGRYSELLGWMAWLAVSVQVSFDAATAFPRHMPSDGVGWLALLLYVTQITLPVAVWPALIVVLVLTGTHAVMSWAFWASRGSNVRDLGLQLAANILVCCGAMVMGLAGSVFMDRLSRKSVLETKSALKAKEKIEGVYKEKETLLLSVLPKHIADEMVKDIGSLSDGQFRKIYMSRYENVSILFADIVGFTSISSNVTAAELVKILNELFGSFDVLANKFHQDRIKILGDCYYCVCGALKARSDHAVLCIHMGLSMVEAIRFVRESTQKDVNMRVGVHTGACLGGVLGLRQWQFDVLGKEVSIANKMESGGLPGRVHISETTRRCLDGEFDLEDGHGGTREEDLRLRNLQTYLVRSVIKPYPQGTLDVLTNGVTPRNENLSKSSSTHSKMGSGTGGGDEDVRNTTRKKEESNERPDNNKDQGYHSNDQRSTQSVLRHITDDSGRKLEQALIDKDKYSFVGRLSFVLTLNFKDKDMQRRYQEASETYSGLPFVSFALALLFAFLARVTLLPRTTTSFVFFACGESVLIIIAMVSMSVSFSKKFPKALVQFAVAIESNQVTRILWSFSAIVVFYLANFIPMVECDTAVHNNSSIQSLDTDDPTCDYVIYFSHSATLILIAVSSLVNVGHLTKACMIYFLVAVQCIFHLVISHQAFDNYESAVYTSGTNSVAIKHKQVAQIVAIAAVLTSMDRLMEWSVRKLFMLKEETKKEKEMLVDLQCKNEALVFNLMPVHVARQFIGIRRPDKELYSQAYNEAGVIFASCPNFNAFYNESAVNNNGLECIRFLNEIISDYDELLNQSCFQSIVKIKTVGSTYMAASGMTVNAKPEMSSTKEKWSHLKDLVQFAFSLQDVLKKINEQSFNNFILRIGINHGPVIAGVIGARKPHYDIWGNTVNVASRMDSTGQAGKIQGMVLGATCESLGDEGEPVRLSFYEKQKPRNKGAIFLHLHIPNVVEETKMILEEFGHQFEKRGLIKVKGKGELMTYFLERKATNMDGLIPNQVPGS